MALGYGRIGSGRYAVIAGRLDQRQLCRTGMLRFPDVPRELVACYGLW